jgi:hypothetical protein
VRPYSENSETIKGWGCGSSCKCKALSSNPVPQKKEKCQMKPHYINNNNKQSWVRRINA